MKSKLFLILAVVHAWTVNALSQTQKQTSPKLIETLKSEVQTSKSLSNILIGLVKLKVELGKGVLLIRNYGLDDFLYVNTANYESKPIFLNLDNTIFAVES